MACNAKITVEDYDTCQNVTLRCTKEAGHGDGHECFKGIFIVSWFANDDEDRCTIWCRGNGITIPPRDTQEWLQIYSEWIEMDHAERRLVHKLKNADKKEK